MVPCKNFFFCPLPWGHITSHPHGVVTLCCVSENKNLVNCARDFNNGDPVETIAERAIKLGQGKITHIINSDFFKSTRLEMIKGHVPDVCQLCLDKERNGIDSPRNYELKKYSNYNLEWARGVTGEDGSIEAKLFSIELRLGNRCNLKCRTCNPVSSSTWIKDWELLNDRIDWIQEAGDFSCLNKDDYSWPLEPNFWEDLERHSSSLESIWFNGGEPFIISEHWEYLERLVKNDYAKSIKLIYHSNFTRLPTWAIDLWSNFKKVELNASIDDLADRNKYIRNEANWDEIVSNLRRIKSAGLKFNVSQTVSPYNVFSLDSFYSWFKKEFNITPISIPVTWPKHFSMAAIPMELREELCQRAPTELRNLLINSFNLSPSDEKEWHRFCEVTKKLDIIRGESFAKTFPDFYSTLKKLGIHKEF